MDNDKLIEAMGMALCENALGGKRCPCREAGTFKCADEHPGHQATAALKALRDTLEPVGYHHTREGYDQYLTFYRVTPEEGWTETPLYALPELKP